MNTTKPTKATLKSFVNKNRGSLLIKNESDFDGMIDSVTSNENPRWRKATENNSANRINYTLGIQGIHLVGGSRNYISYFNTETLSGFHVCNCCGSFSVAIEIKEIK